MAPDKRILAGVPIFRRPINGVADFLLMIEANAVDRARGEGLSLLMPGSKEQQVGGLVGAQVLKDTADQWMPAKPSQRFIAHKVGDRAALVEDGQRLVRCRVEHTEDVTIPAPIVSLDALGGISDGTAKRRPAAAITNAVSTILQLSKLVDYLDGLMITTRLTLIGCLLVATLVSIMALIRATLIIIIVENTSMSPTLQPGDRLLAVRHWPVRWIRRGAIVLIPIISQGSTISHKSAPSSGQIIYIKRVVGLPGDTLVTSISELDIISRKHQAAAHNVNGQRTWHIPSGYVFLRGDHPIGGFDSLSWGPVALKNIFAVAVLKLSSQTNLNTSSLEFNRHTQA